MFWFERIPSPSQRRSRVIRDQARVLVEQGGATTHSALGHTLRIMVQYLEEARCPYTITAVPGQGYVLEARPHGHR